MGLSGRLGLVISSAVALSICGCASNTTGVAEGSTSPSVAGPNAATMAYADVYWNDFIARKYPDAERPSVEFKGYVTIDDWAQTHVDCLTAKGFNAVPDGGAITIAPGQDPQAVAVANYECFLEHPLDMTGPDAPLLPAP